MTIELGGNIKLTGFRELEPGHLTVVKKMVGNFVRKFNTANKVDELQLTLKPIHEAPEKSEAHRFEMHAKVLSNGKVLNAKHTGFNLFVTLNEVLDGLEHEMDRA